MTGPRVTVAVVTHDSERLVRGLVDSLADGMRDTSWELVVADNASGDGSVAAVHAAAPEARVVQLGRNAGYAAGINAAVRAASEHDAILVLNPDVRLAPGCAAHLYAEMTRRGAGLAVPRLDDAAGELIPSIRREPTVLRAWGEAVLGAERAGRFPRLGEVETRPSTYEGGAVVDWAEGSTVMVSADCWRRCGPWDESFFLYSEETEYALRARDLGLAGVYVPQARATHLEGGSDSPVLWTLLVVNKVRLFGSRAGRARTAGFWAAQVVREGTRALLGRRTSRAAVAALVNPRRLRDAPGPHWL